MRKEDAVARHATIIDPIPVLADSNQLSGWFCGDVIEKHLE